MLQSSQVSDYCQADCAGSLMLQAARSHTDAASGSVSHCFKLLKLAVCMPQAGSSSAKRQPGKACPPGTQAALCFL